jgi:hypothetical protein
LLDDKSVSTVLNRLARYGEARLLANDSGRRAWQWVTDKSGPAWDSFSQSRSVPEEAQGKSLANTALFLAVALNGDASLGQTDVRGILAAIFPPEGIPGT